MTRQEQQQENPDIDFSSILHSPCTLIALNQPLPISLLARALEITTNDKRQNTLIAADGGADRLVKASMYASTRLDRNVDLDTFVPDIVTGDFDSISASCLEHLTSHPQCTVKKEYGQDTTDLQKCLQYVDQVQPKEPTGVAASRPVFALGALGGRLDHSLSNISLLQKVKSMSLTLVSIESTAQLIPAGKTTIYCLESLQGPTCGLIPVYGPVHVKTMGLKWEISGEMAMNGLVSSSNSFKGLDETDDQYRLVRNGKVYYKVTVETSRDILWTCELKREANEHQ